MHSVSLEAIVKTDAESVESELFSSYCFIAGHFHALFFELFTRCDVQPLVAKFWLKRLLLEGGDTRHFMEF